MRISECSSVVCSSDLAPPYRIIDGSTRPPRDSSIYVVIARTAAARAGVRLDFIQVPYAGAFAMMQNGDGDLMLGPNRTPEREAYLLYLDPALPEIGRAHV